MALPSHLKHKVVVLKYTNPEIPECINVSDANPLKEFGLLVTGSLIAVVLITALLAYSVDWLAEYIPFDYEISIAKSFESETEKRNLIDDYLQDLTDDIVLEMALPEGMDVTVHYVNQDVVNAMATLGGHIFIYRGLLEKLPHENALVMLLGHEIGHVKLRHPIKALGKGIVISLVFSALLGQSSDAASAALVNTSALTLLGFSREQEEDADLEGLSATQYYFKHVQGADDLFNVLLNEQDEQGVYVPQIMNSHPDTDHRVTLIEKFSNDQQWLMNGVLKPIPKKIKNKLADDSSTELLQ